MSRRLNRCCECGGIFGHHMTNCPETPDAPDDGEGIENEESMETEDNNDDE